MYKGPHATVWYDERQVTNDAELRRALLDMEIAIPGVTVWCRDERGMKALRNLPDARYTIVWATFPAHAAYLYGKLPEHMRAVLMQAETRRSDKTSAFKWLPKVKPESEEAAQVAIGREAVDRLVKSGYVSQEQAELIYARWYQLFTIGTATERAEWLRILTRIDGGGGKTATALMIMLALGCQRILAVVPPHMRDPYTGWPKEIRLFTKLKAYVGWSASDPRRAKQEWPTLAAYTHSQQMQRLPAIAVFGFDLGDHLSDLTAYCADGIIIDEVHKLGNAKKFRRVVNDAGKEVSQRVTTEVLGRVNRASALDSVCSSDRVKAIVELTATAFDDGDPETVHNALSLLDFAGTKYAFLGRYKNGPPSADARYPQYAERSPSNVTELKTRLKAWYLDIPSEVTKRFIPRCIINPVRIAPSALGTGRGYGITARQKALDKEARGWSARDREKAGLEFDLEVAAVKKLPAVKAVVLEALEDNKRVVVYANRIEVVDFIFASIMDEAPPETWGRAIHSAAKFDTGKAIEEYSELPLGKPALIVGGVDSIGTGVNGLAETDLACYVQLTQNPTTLIQAIYRHERPKPRMGAVPTIFNVYIAEGTIDESVETNFLARGEAALALAKTEGLSAVMEAVDASSLMSAEQLAKALTDGTFGKDETGSGLGGGEWGSLGDDDDLPF